MTMKRVYELKNLNLDDRQLRLNETLFHNANGYIGVRYGFEEGYPEGYTPCPGQYINGFYDFADLCQAERLFGLTIRKQTMLNIADTLAVTPSFDGERFSMFTGNVLESSLALDMDRGVTVRKILWRSPAGREIRLKITRMASFYQLPLFTIEYEIEPLNFSGELVIDSRHSADVQNAYDIDDPRLASAAAQHLLPVSCQFHEDVSFILAKTSSSGLEVCSCVKNVLSQDGRRDYTFNSHTADCRIISSIQQGKTVRLTKYAVFCDSIRYENCVEQASREMERAMAAPLRELYGKQAEYLSDFWQSCCVHIEAPGDLNMAVQYNLFQLIQSVGKDRHCSVAPKGLSGEGYEGHYFWDAEMYIQPFFTITNPDISRNLIDYRYATLPRAKENAAVLGHKKGALYPWRTIMGEECSGYFPAGSAQYHINGDIAYAIITYYLATKDLRFILEKGAEILFETARLWLDTGNYHNGQFHLNDVTGPDEYTCLVNNNYYTNVLAQHHLRWAVRFYQLLSRNADFQELARKIDLKETEIVEFQRAADNMVLPYDDALKLNPQDDSFLQKRKWDLRSIPKDKFPLLLHYHPLHLNRHQLCKQADTVMAHFAVEDAQDMETMRNSYLYYENITAHDSSLSKCIFSIMAARLGFEKKAYDYFHDAAYIDLRDLHRNTKYGIHVGNMGGNYMAVVFGFGGFRLKEAGISFAPILPEKWTGYQFKVTFEGSRILTHVSRDECSFHLESGAPKEITVYGRKYLLTDTLTVGRERGRGGNDEV